MPASPPIFPTPENVFDNAIATGADYVSTVPPFVEVRMQSDLGKSGIATKLAGVGSRSAQGESYEEDERSREYVLAFSMVSSQRPVRSLEARR